eukprot:scaffold168598_cov40-Prasinocladus_malaysianus.AAC.1
MGCIISGFVIQNIIEYDIVLVSIIVLCVKGIMSVANMSSMTYSSSSAPIVCLARALCASNIGLIHIVYSPETKAAPRCTIPVALSLTHSS